MFDSPQLQRATPANETTIQILGGEENDPINHFPSDSRRLSTKRSTPDHSVMKDMPQDYQCRPDKRTRSVAGSELDDAEVSSTVSARREWLKAFGKQHESAFPKKTSNNTPAPPSTRPLAAKLPQPSPSKHTTPVKAPVAPSAHSSASAATASLLVNRLMSSEPRPARKPASVLPKKKMDKGQVQATDDGYASVAQLSQWLANDPTSTKKKKHVRRGRNVITKSRQFEKDMEDVIIVESSISRGAVKDRKNWLKEVFHHDEEYEEETEEPMPRYAKSEVNTKDFASAISVSSQKDWLKNAFRAANQKEEPQPEPKEVPRFEIVTNDAASSLSVSDKKDWLKNAFQKGGKSAFPSKTGPAKAMTDIVHNRGGDAAERAKQRFRQSSRRTPVKSTPPVSKSGASRGMSPSVQPRTQLESKNDRPIRDDGVEERTAPEVAPIVFEEDTTAVDFRSAREALVTRGTKNGHSMQVVNKVHLRKNKFENMEKEFRRRSGAHGLLKPSWEESDPSSGRPSNAYDKKYVSDIAPKKSFEELP